MIQKYKNIIIFSFFILLSLLIRYSLLGFESTDYKAWLSNWYEFIKSHGGFWALKYNFANYTPPYLYLLIIATGLPFPSLTAIKLISIIFDYSLAFFVYLTVKLKYKKGIIPVMSFFAVLFLPTVIFNSSLWAQCDTIYTTWLIGSLYFIIREKILLAFIFLSLAFAFKLQTIFLFPVYIILSYKKNFSIKYFLLIPLIYIISIIPTFIAGRPFNDLLSIYGEQIAINQKLTMNAPTLYQWISNHYYYPVCHIGVAVTLLITCLFMFIIHKSKINIKEETVIKLSLAFSLIIPYFLPKMHERYFFPADIISIIYAFYYPRKFFIPVLINIASLFSYFPFLFGSPFIPLSYLALILLITIIAVTTDIIKNLYPVTYEGDESPFNNSQRA